MSTLVLFTSKHGTTKKAAEYIGEKIEGSIIANLAENDLNIEHVDNIVLGTPVYFGRISPLIKTFIEENNKFLKDKNFYLFVSCIKAMNMNKVLRDNLPLNLPTYTKQILCASGEVNPKKINFFEKLYCILSRKMAGANFIKLNYEMLDKIIDDVNSNEKLKDLKEIDD